MLKFKWSCPVCEKEPEPEFRGLYKPNVCRQNGEYVFCGDCFMQAKKREWSACPLGCRKEWSLLATKWAPYPSFLEEAILNERQVLARQAARERREQRYQQLTEKRQRELPDLTEDDMEADLQAADEEDRKDLEKLKEQTKRLRLQPWLAEERQAIHDVMQAAIRAYKEMKREENMKKEIKDVLTFFEKSTYNGKVYPATCWKKGCLQQFKTRKQLDDHQINDHKLM